MSIDEELASSPDSSSFLPDLWHRHGQEQARLSTKSLPFPRNGRGPATRSNNRSSAPDVSGWKPRDDLDFAPWDQNIVLSCSGGGVRALCQLYLLRILFERVAHFEKLHDPENTSSADSPLFRLDADRKKSDFRPKFRVPITPGTYLPCHYFDYIGGTSVGGIMAVMFGRLRLSVDQSIRSFETIWRTMGSNMSGYERVLPFRRAKNSNSMSFDRAFQEVLNDRRRELDEVFKLYKNSFDVAMGRDAVSDDFASDPELCKTIVIAMPDGLEDGLQRPFLFRSYDERGEGLSSLTRVTSGGSVIQVSSPSTILINDICRATSAAPGFFKGVNIGHVKFRDGALWTNNPALELYRGIEASSPATSMDPTKSIKLLVSLGSGQSKPRRSLSAHQHSKTYAYDDTIDPVLSKHLDTGYWSFEGPKDLTDLKINEWRIDGSGYNTFKRIRKSTEEYARQRDVTERIDALAQHLVKLRQSRAKTKRWERFALGIRYTCQAKPPCEQKFEDSDSFMDHLMWEHNEPPQDGKNWNHIQKLFADSQTTTVK